MRIYKYNLSLNPYSENKFTLPVNSKALTVEVQNGSPFVYVKIVWDKDEESEVEKENHTFHVLPTGDNLPDIGGIYVGTFTINGYVFHVFDVIKKVD